MIRWSKTNFKVKKNLLSQFFPVTIEPKNSIIIVVFLLINQKFT